MNRNTNSREIDVELGPTRLYCEDDFRSGSKNIETSSHN